jgi:hypothetical protein
MPEHDRASRPQRRSAALRPTRRSQYETNGACSAHAVDISMTSVMDGRTHTITAGDFDVGVWNGRGRYRAACGVEVVAAALASNFGPNCPNCPPLPTREQPRPGVLVRLIAALTAATTNPAVDTILDPHEPADSPTGPGRAGGRDDGHLRPGRIMPPNARRRDMPPLQASLVL